MHKNLKVLFIAISENNMLPALRALNEGGLYPVWDWVQTAELLRMSLDDQVWDVMIAEHRSPQLSAFSALAVVNETQVDIPCIVLSHVAGERLAVDMLKAGAHDYLMMDDLTLLPTILRREILAAESRLRQKQSLLGLQAAEATYRAIYNNAVEGIYQSTPQGRYVMVNRALAQMYGYDSSEQLVTQLNNIRQQLYVDPQRRDQFEVILLQQGYISGFESMIYRRDGATLWVSESGRLVKDERGEPSYYEGFVTDISDRKRAEQALQHLNHQLEGQVKARTKALILIQSAVDFAADCVFLICADGSFHYVNNTACDKLGYSQAEFMQMKVWEINPTVSCDGWPDIWQTIKQQKSFTTESQHQSKDGHLYPIEINTKYLHFDGEDYCFSFVRDISDRKQFDAERKQSQQNARLLASVVESTDDAIITRNLDGIITSWNPAAVKLFGYAEAEVIGQPISILFPPDRLDIEPQILNRLWQGERISHFETVNIHKNGTPIQVSATISPLKDNLGNVVGAAKIVRDITQRKQADMQLRLTNEELLRATRLKDEFLANMSHELRTPLNAILGMAESLQEQVFGNVHEQQIKPLQMISRSGNHLLELINDILDVTKIESGHMELTLKPTAVIPLCRSSLDFVKQQACTKYIQVDAQFPSYIPNVRLDERRIRQVLINLLSNAVKFTPEGGRVTLNVSLRHETPSLGYILRIAISDTGIGIARKHINKLFQPFIQIDSALNRKYSGTGLGLTLVKRIVELHGGDVTVTSKVASGSCFTIDLPCTIIPPPPPPGLPQKLFPPGKNQATSSIPSSAGASLILLAKYQEAHMITIVSYLRAKGYYLQMATDGQDVVAISRANRPDLILIDSQMPNINSIEVIKEIRHTPPLVTVPIIALTNGSDFNDEHNQYPALGVYQYLNKPFQVKQLVDVMQQMLQQV